MEKLTRIGALSNNLVIVPETTLGCHSSHFPLFRNGHSMELHTTFWVFERTTWGIENDHKRYLTRSKRQWKS